MIITMSPAKLLDFDSDVSIKESSTPIYQAEAAELNALVKDIGVEDIASLMKINPQLARDTFEYIHTFGLPQTPKRQAVFVYNGIAYQGLDAATLTREDLSYAQDHLALFSGMYGLLRPLDLISPYRLELQTGLANKRGKNLYDYWSDALTKHLSKMILENGNIWINLSSNEYTKVIDCKQLPKGTQIITPIFKEARGNGYKQIVVYAKKARGMMARFIVQNRIENTEYLKAFDTEGYSYSEQLSNEQEWVFVR